MRNSGEQRGGHRIFAGAPIAAHAFPGTAGGVRRPLLPLLAAFAAVAGCGGGHHGATTSTATTAPPPAPAPPQAGLIFGIGDQGSAMFSNPLFRALGVRHARLVAGWDSADVPSERAS